MIENEEYYEAQKCPHLFLETEELELVVMDRSALGPASPTLSPPLTPDRVTMTNFGWVLPSTTSLYPHL